MKPDLHVWLEHSDFTPQCYSKFELKQRRTIIVPVSTIGNDIFVNFVNT
jgi:hypothetical protein